MRRGNQIVVGLELRRDVLQEDRTHLGRQATVWQERGGGLLDGTIDMGVRRFLELRQRAAGGETSFTGLDRSTRNQASAD